MALVPISTYIQESRTMLQTSPFPPDDIRVNLNINFRLCRRDPTTGHDIPFSSDFFASEYVCFNLDILCNYSRLREVLDPLFSRLGIDTSSGSYSVVLRKIVERGLEIPRTMVHGGSYISDVWLSCEVRLRALPMGTEIDRSGLLTRSLVELVSEIESINRRIASLTESWIKAMLNTVEVEDGDEETCVICLEELEVGLKASRMPCSHDFHSHCIEKWLHQNLNCPICRLKIP
ncbi:hypothetical protein HRI_001074200 [Hibiscus trionum]|uniref:RING-type domain-containing protein n=1 Tax=Hibiscus trionum TaxID=183268 RepID=A0A9W7HAQ1_HIBTR|nr:hypothetical protein HRI_001074200 [Hibiscus trionum]